MLRDDGCELICFARKRHHDKSTQRQITSDFPKLCQARESKIFRFRSHANQSHNSARLTADEGRWPSSRTCGEMRWTQELRLTCVARAYGEVVWFGRRGAGVKRAIRSAGDGGKRAVLREEHEVSRKAIAQGRPECFRRTCMLVCAFLCANCTRDRGCGAHPVFPAPLCPGNLSECANGRLRVNRPLLELSPLRPKATEPVSERGTAPVSSSTRTVARASSPDRARKGVDDGTK